MRFIPLLLLAAIFPACAPAQKDEDGIRARLVDKPLYLRGQWDKDKLQFDERGQLAQKPPLGGFTLAGIEIRKVKLTSKELALEGNRVGLEFTTEGTKRVKLEPMTIRIKRPDDGDFAVALDTIFTDSPAGLSEPMPSYWRDFAQRHLVAGAPPSDGRPISRDASGAGTRPSVPTPDKIGSVTAPVLTWQSEPQYTLAARAAHYQGVVLVNFIVKPDGTPAGIRILRPVGLGLDEAAVAAVAEYRFKPAMKDGKPVAVEMNVEVNFQIF